MIAGRRAELLVAQTGWTLHQFRHSALTHLAENDVQLPLLMAKSRTLRRAGGGRGCERPRTGLPDLRGAEMAKPAAMTDEERAERRKHEQQLTEQAVAQLRSSAGCSAG